MVLENKLFKTNHTRLVSKKQHKNINETHLRYRDNLGWFAYLIYYLFHGDIDILYEILWLLYSDTEEDKIIDK